MNLPGVYRGIVIGAADPMMHGRMNVRIPALGGGIAQWAAVCTPLGSTARPDPSMIGKEVWVTFEGGDSTRPVVLGAA